MITKILIYDKWVQDILLGLIFKDDLIPNKELIRNYNIFSDVIETFLITIMKC